MNVGSLKYSVEGKNRKSVGLQEIAIFVCLNNKLYKCCATLSMLLNPSSKTHMLTDEFGDFCYAHFDNLVF